MFPQQELTDTMEKFQKNKDLSFKLETQLSKFLLLYH